MKHDEPLDDRELWDAARRLGAAAADRVNVDRVAEAVTRRLREAPPTRFGWLRIAAAVVALLGGGLAVREVVRQNGRAGVESAYFVADDLSDLSAEELRELLAALDDTSGPGGVGGLGPPEGGSDLTELDALQLRAVLRTLEG
ncbi:MAG: hypothetical protein Q8Q14_01290 [Gemmatimonadales bacterium]|nr:hypothetical protein [Gemmatimonadales bacterium]